MKLIEGMKLLKELEKKAQDLRTKIGAHCAYLSIETPVYPDQKAKVDEWLQAHGDLMQEIAKLAVRVAKTNLATMVTIEVGGNSLAKPITEWVLRRRKLAPLDYTAWSFLGDRNLKEGQVPSSVGGMGVPTPVKIVRCYDPVARDAKLAVYMGEPGLIDRTLEVVNATTDLLE